jgi:choice-of-anchor A domain-containing protein
MKLIAYSAAILLSATSAASAVTFTAADLLHGFNNIVLTDRSGGAETEGTVFVGGNDSSSANVNPDGEGNVDLGGGIVGSYIVGGNVSGNTNLNNGNAQIGGAVTGTLNNNGLGSVNTGVVGIPVAEVRTILENLSVDLAAEATTAGGTANTGDTNNINFQSGAGDADQIQFFNIAGTVLNSGTFNGVTAPAGVTTIINVSGANVSIGVNANLTQPNVLFNFFEATTLNITSAFNYSILAPLANITQNGGGINGTVVSNNLVQNAEIRPLHFTGNLPTETVLTPSPATALLMISGMAGLAAFARRKG